MTLLNPGDTFPALNVALPGGDTLALPGALAGGVGVILFYRGSWCPYCNAQLRAFQRASGRLAEIGTRVVAVSVDDEALAAGTPASAAGVSLIRVSRDIYTDATIHAPAAFAAPAA